MAGFYTDNTSPWVLSSIHIQRVALTQTGQQIQKSHTHNSQLVIVLVTRNS
jgi:hypothetical protein